MTHRSPLPALLVAGASSGCGKTTLSLALMAAFRHRGLAVQAFKTGPDFLDPAWHAVITGRPSFNLDAWMQTGAPQDEWKTGDSLLRQWALATAQPADMAIVEGAMGLFDGLPGQASSCADIACLLHLPVLLVLDVRGMAATAAAVAYGLASFRPELPVLGLVCSRTGSPRHAHILRRALTEACPEIPLLGFFPRDDRLTLPSRHLGLIPPDRELSPSFLQTLAACAEANLDLDALLEAARRFAEQRPEPARPPCAIQKRPRVPIAIARDEAFSFWYPEHDALLEAAGAELLPFSPLRDSGLPGRAQGLILPGGYPELYAERLSANCSLRESIRSFARQHPVYGECGGDLVLMDSLEKNGQWLPLCGCLPLKARLEAQYSALGYREVRGLAGPWQGLVLRGHEFHYSRITDYPDTLPSLWSCTSPREQNGLSRTEGTALGQISASYIHLSFLSHPLAASRFVETCRNSA